MKIQLHAPPSKIYEGTPREIVTQLREDARPMPRDNRALMRQRARELGFHITARTADEYYENFLKNLFTAGYAKRLDDVVPVRDRVSEVLPTIFTDVDDQSTTSPPTKHLKFVTCLFDLTRHGSTQHRDIHWMFANSSFVMNLEQPLVVFTDPEWVDEIHRRRDGRPTEIIPTALDNLIDHGTLTRIRGARLQENARRTKVTPIYVALMWAKYQMLTNVTRTEEYYGKQLARMIPDTPAPTATHLGWIDFSIQHVAAIDGLDSTIFADPSSKPRVHMLRYFDQTDCADADFYYQHVHGHLAGGLVVGGVNEMKQLADRFMIERTFALDLGRAPLDEGILSRIVAAHPDDYTFSYGDYADILRNHDRPRGGRDHLLWQRQDAKERGADHHVAMMDMWIRAIDGHPYEMVVSGTPIRYKPDVESEVPVITPEMATELAREGAADAKAYLERTKKMERVAMQRGDELYAKMQKPGFEAARKQAFAASPEEIGRTAVEAAKPQGLLGLVMIVKNEAHGIGSTLVTIRDHIDYWSILDTGSTDGTQDAIREILVNVPGTLHEEPFVDFSTSRNRILDLHGEKTQFTLMVDADDMLANASMLRGTLLMLAKNNQDAYLVELRRDQLSYYLPLVLRTSAKWRYRYRVHEVCGPTVGEGYAVTKIPHVQLLQSRPAQSAEATAARWERDLKFLREDYIANPRDARILFYLAQTYECLSRPVEALRVYDERIAVGGWEEETYEAKLRRAKILDALERRSRDPKIVRDAEEIRVAPTWAVVQAAYLDLYAEKPTRAEPLFSVAEHWYDAQVHPLAFLYAQRAAATKRPADGLFIDAHIYEYRAAALAAISGFYCDSVGDPSIKVAARRCAEQAVRAQPHNNEFRSNWAFYARSAKELFPKYVEKPIDIKPPDPFVANNPSILWDVDSHSWVCVVRSTNYRIVDGQYLTLDENGKQVPLHDNPIVTRNWFLRLDYNLDVTKTVEMIDRTGIPHSSYPVHGFEDCRLFKWRDEYWCTSTVCDFDLDKPHEGPREIVAFKFNLSAGDIVYARPIRGPWSVHAQKNWMPVVDNWAKSDDPLQIIYATMTNGNQATVMTLNDVDPLDLQMNIDNYGHGRLRGGGQVVCINDEEYLAIVHDVAWTGGNARIYTHRFVLFNNDFQVKKVSDPFHFKKLGIEFCAGLAYDGDKQLVASFGVDDREPYFGTFDLDEVLRALRSDYVI